MGQDQGKAAPAPTAGAAAAAVPAAGGYTLPPGATLPPTAVAGGAAAAAASPPPPAAGACDGKAPATPAIAVVAAAPPPFNRMDSAATAKALAAAVDAAAEGDTPLTPDQPPAHKRNVSDGALVRAAVGSPDSPAPIRSLLSRAVVTHDSPHIKTRRAADAKLSAEQTQKVVEEKRFVEVRNAKAAGTTLLDSQVTFLADGTCYVEHLSPSNGAVVQKRWGQYFCADGGKVTLKLTSLHVKRAAAASGAGAASATAADEDVAILDEIAAIVSQCDSAHPDLTVVARDDEAPDPLHALAGTRYRRV